MVPGAVELGPVELPDAALFSAARRYGDMCIHVALDLGSPVAEEDLRRALAATLADFPVLDCRYQPGFWRDRWVRVARAPEDALLVLPRPEDDGELERQTLSWARRPMDPTTDRQLRIVAWRSATRTRLLLSVQHLAVDGAGLAALGASFAAHLRREALPARPTRRRDVWSVLGGLRRRHLPLLAASAVREAARPLEQVTAARRERPYPRAPEAEIAFRTVVVSPDDLAELRRRCGGSTVNEILVAALAVVAGGRSEGGPVLVTYTMDLRRHAREARLWAANVSSILAARVDRAHLADLATAAAEVAAGAARRRARLAGPAFMVGPVLLGAALPHGLLRHLVGLGGALLVDLPLARGLLLTNVGRIDEGLRALEADVERVRILGPSIRGLQAPVVVAFGHRGALHLQLVSPPGLGEPALDELERELRAALALGPSPARR